MSALKGIAVGFDIELKGDAIREMTNNLFTETSKRFDGSKVVFLVDEYDAPIVDHLNDRELAKANREVMASFYACVKSQTNIHFQLYTGVTKVSYFLILFISFYYIFIFNIVHFILVWKGSFIQRR